MIKNIQTSYRSIEVNIELNKKVTILDDISGSGKTFLFEILSAYFVESDIKYILINYDSCDISIDGFKAAFKNVDFILLDNTDLYLTEDLVKLINESDKVFIIASRELAYMGLYDYTVKRVIIENNLLRLG